MNSNSDIINVHILLSTFNGAEYIDEFIESVVNQTHPHWVMSIRDDGSTDDTIWQINIRNTSDKRIRFIADSQNHLGAAGSFNELLLHITPEAQFVAFADQDDIWMPNKLERLLAKADSIHNTEKPLLIHSDMKVVDEKCNVLADSFHQYQNLDPLQIKPSRLLVQNVAPGCAMLANRTLIDLAAPIPGQAFMHDWWLALVASAFGTIIYLDEPLLMYRQHTGNRIGSQKYSEIITNRIMQTFFNPSTLSDVSRRLSCIQIQAGAFAERYASILPDRTIINAAKALADMANKSRLSKITGIMKHDLWQQGIARNIALALLA